MRDRSIVELTFGVLAVALTIFCLGSLMFLVHSSQARHDGFIERCMKEGMLPKGTCEWIWLEN